MASDHGPGNSSSVAIIGAGISGIVLALALEERGISYRIYEQASEYSQLGAGLNFNPAGVRALEASSRAAFEAYMEVRAPHHPSREDLYFAYTDGDRSFELLTSEGHGAVRRSVWIAAMTKRVPKDLVYFRKRVKNVTEFYEEGTAIEFEDGSKACADVVIGCDGVKSKIRRQIVGTDHPSADPSFSHFVAYRSFMKREDARKVIGPKLADAAHYRKGPGISYVSYPISGGEHNNLGIFESHPGAWPHFPSVSASTSKQELMNKITDPHFKEMASYLADELDVWAIYDLADHPLPTYARGRMALVGDSAHGSSPNLGAGAGVSIEDAVVLAELLHEVVSIESSNETAKRFAHLELALAAFSDARIERTQWLVDSSRHLGKANLGDPVWGGDWNFEDYERDTTEKYHAVWQGQIDDMVFKAKESYRERIK